ncbi:hypothetical protein ZTR_03814 [Talaromyces verruculosus]|nr:hypothetical protein ZTR_03814 [Talaromyces verruculosus]
MTPEQISVITKTVPVLEQYGQRITKKFYRNTLAAHPELQSVFNMTNQHTGHQAKVLAQALYAYAANIHNLEVLGPMLELVCQKHASLHITPDQYDIVGKYLIEAMQEVLGDNFTPDSSLYDQHTEWKDWRDFRIVTISRESDEISSFYLSPVDEKPLPSFIPGQYVSVRALVPQFGYSQARQYSMSEIPLSSYYRISVKREEGQRFPPGLLSNILHDLEAPGQIVQVSHPRGDFYLSNANNSSPIVLIAGGVGITPLLSMLKFLAPTSSSQKRPVHFVYATRTTAARAFFKEITEVTKSGPLLRVTYFVESPVASDQLGKEYHHVGRLDFQRLDAEQDLFLNHQHAEYYICGPSLFLQTVKVSLLSRGVGPSRIKMEVFGAGGFVETSSQPHL